MLNQANLLAQLQRVQMLQQAGRIGEAWTAITPMRAAIDGHGQALRLYALVAQAAGQVDPAADALRRIIAIEREPPEIVGALADLLGKAGRHDEALALWTRLVALHPHAADAHLNRAVTAAQAGQHELAVTAASEGLARSPGHARLLATKAMALKNAGRVEESLTAFEAAVAADPNRAMTRHNHAVALRAASRFDEACEAYAASARLGMSGAQFHANWAAAALEGERVDEAIEQYRLALAQDPAHPESRVGLTRLQIEYRGGEEAFAHYERIATARNQLADWVDYANALLSHRRNAEAAEVTERALGQYGGNPELLALKAYAIGIEGDAEAALRSLEQAFAGRGDLPLPSMAMLALRAGDAAKAAAFAERITELRPDDQGAWSILSIAWRLLDDPREHWLCDYDRLVMVTEVAPDDWSGTAADYAREVAAVLDPLHQTRAAPGDQSLRGGTQTSGALFERPDPAIQRFRHAVIAAAERAVAALPVDPGHPFLRRRSDRLAVVGSWSVRLSGGGGHHVSHYHGEGWMSSAYYARLPDVPRDDWLAQDGWIQFGVPPEMVAIELPPRRVVEPAVGRLVLFPSYLLHGTMPFGTGDRLTAAFDFQPR